MDVKSEVMPNILFMEIDSLSESAALRHMPQTLAVLKSHGMVRGLDKKVHCPTGFCTAMFNQTSVIGQNSIPNQLAALSGCVDDKLEDVDMYERKPVRQVKEKDKFTSWCPASKEENPWLFDVVKKLGYVTFFGEEFCYSNSPYVVQGNYFNLTVDYDMNEIFCRLSKVIQSKTDAGVLWLQEHDTSDNPDPCIDGRSRQELALEYIRGIWDAYPNTPKFAYLNSLAAHDYSVDLAYQPLGLEKYDDFLSSFLLEMLDRPDAKNTIIILRSDHGLQGGPSPIDYSFQVEHMRPFNNLIVPKEFSGLSIESLFRNQNKLVTGYDLYHTIRKIIIPRLKNSSGEALMDQDHTESHSIPDWSFNLIQDNVPMDRTCEDAKIPKSFCPCLEERNDLMPYYYVGYSGKINSFYSNDEEKVELLYNVDIDDDDVDVDDNNMKNTDRSNSKVLPYQAVFIPGRSVDEYQKVKLLKQKRRKSLLQRKTLLQRKEESTRKELDESKKKKFINDFNHTMKTHSTEAVLQRTESSTKNQLNLDELTNVNEFIHSLKYSNNSNHAKSEINISLDNFIDDGDDDDIDDDDVALDPI